jgi:DNA-binding beta-propeller fold protein YncE
MRVQRFNSVISGLTLFSLVSAIFLMVCGCGSGTISNLNSSGKVTMAARVMGGRQAISGAAIALSEAGTSGPITSSVIATATSDAQGNFNIDVPCVNQNSQVYITATGGDAGNGTNTNIKFQAMLGACNALPDNVVINELSTVASVYTFAQFMRSTDPSKIGAGGAPLSAKYTGMTNAGLTLSTNVINIATGKPAAFLTKNGNSPATMNTLADILVACVNSVSPFSTCNSLYTAATPSGGSAPTNTLQAAYNIATHPGTNVGLVYGVLAMLPADVPAPFTPDLGVAPNDWLLALKHSPANLNTPQTLAIDSGGNVWIANYGAGNGSNTIIELSPLGTATGFSPAGVNGTKAIHFDTTGNLWVANYDGSTVESIDSSGAVVVPAFGFGGFLQPSGIAPDSFGLIWAADHAGGAGGNNVIVATNTGTLSFALVTAFSLDAPLSIVSDNKVSPNVEWVTNTVGGAVSALTNNGTSTVTGGFLAGVGTTLYGLAVDNTGAAWVSDNNGSTGSVSKINNVNPLTLALGPIAVGGITSTSAPAGIAIDSANNVWVNNTGGGVLAELDSNGNALSPAGGFTAGGLITTPDLGIAVDRSGNVWVANAGTRFTSSIVELLGAAAPVATPATDGRPTAP